MRVVTANGLRKIARGKFSRRNREEALEKAADHIEHLDSRVADCGGLVERMAMTIGAIVIASGGRVEVPKSVMEDLGNAQIEKLEGLNGSIIYRVKDKNDG